MKSVGQFQIQDKTLFVSLTHNRKIEFIRFLFLDTIVKTRFQISCGSFSRYQVDIA